MSKIEIELKVLEVDVDDLVGRLEQVGARLAVDGVLDTILFDDEIGTIRESLGQVRARTFGDQVEYTVKTNPREIQGCKVYDEDEKWCGTLDEATKIFAEQGYLPVIRYEKRRKEFHLEDGSKIEIDTFPGVPAWAEIEAESRQRIDEIIEEFGLGGYETSSLTGEEILRARYGIEMNGLRFNS